MHTPTRQGPSIHSPHRIRTNIITRLPTLRQTRTRCHTSQRRRRIENQTAGSQKTHSLIRLSRGQIMNHHTMPTRHRRRLTHSTQQTRTRRIHPAKRQHTSQTHAPIILINPPHRLTQPQLIVRRLLIHRKHIMNRILQPHKVLTSPLRKILSRAGSLLDPPIFPAPGLPLARQLNDAIDHTRPGE